MADFRPTGRPFYTLAGTLLAYLDPELSETGRLVETKRLAEALQEVDLALGDVLGRILEKQGEGHRLLLIADQFEELYTLVPDVALRQRFLDVILDGRGGFHTRPNNTHLYNTRPNDTHLVLTLRADFMGQALAYPPLVAALQDSDLKLGPMDADSLQAAIVEPARRVGVSFEAGLVERILDDVGTEGSNLPLLEFALTQLWEWQAPDRQLTHVAYEQIGQVKGALAGHAARWHGEDAGHSQRE